MYTSRVNIRTLSICAMISRSGMVLKTRVLSCSSVMGGRNVRREYMALRPEIAMALAPVMAPVRIASPPPNDAPVTLIFLYARPSYPL